MPCVRKTVPADGGDGGTGDGDGDGDGFSLSRGQILTGLTVAGIAARALGGE